MRKLKVLVLAAALSLSMASTAFLYLDQGLD